MVTITIDGKQYNLELKARMIETVELTLKSKKSLIDIFMPVDVKVNNKKDAEVGSLKYCSLGDMLRIFWAELQVNNTNDHIISYDEACDLYDRYIVSEEGRKLGPIGFYVLLGKGARFFTNADVKK